MGEQVGLVLWDELETNDYDGFGYALSLGNMEQSIENNTTTFDYWFVSRGNSGTWYAERTLKVVINGTTVYSKTNRVERHPFEIIAQGSITIPHNTDGTKSFTASIQAAVYESSINVSGSKTFEIKPIPRYARITSAPDFTDEESPTITYTNALGNGVDSLDACISFDGSNPDIAYRSISKTGNTYTFNLTEAERNTLRSHITNKKSDTVYFYIRTVINGEFFFTYLKKTLTIVNSNPTISASFIDTNSKAIELTGDSSVFIKYVSNLKYTINATALKYATIKKYTISCGDNTLSTATGVFNGVAYNNITVSVEDSRGYITTKTYTPQMVNYVPLTCGIKVSNISTDGELTLTVSGNYYNGTFGAVNNKLKLWYRLYYSHDEKNYISSNYTESLYTLNDNSYTMEWKITGLDYRLNYIIKAFVADQVIDELEAAPYKVSSYPVFDWSETDFNFNVPVHFAAGASGDIGNYGEWKPTLDASAISYYSTQKGWYQKEGNVITAGFYIKAGCNTGYQTTSISIDGLPFIPSIAAAGGGMCSGAYVSSGFTFQCWVAGTDSSITARVQQVNHTTATNLATSASGCFYRNNGGEITLSGTIIYITNEGGS